MKIDKHLLERSDSKCELCYSTDGISELEVLPKPDCGTFNRLVVCRRCLDQIEGREELDSVRWRRLGDSMWCGVPAVEVMAYRMLKKFPNEVWAQDLIEQQYMEDHVRAWAEQGEIVEATVDVKDCNGTTLKSGDNVTLIKDLDVKGANFTAKRGTTVKNISLTDDPGLIEGKVNGTQIVLKTCFLKKA